MNRTSIASIAAAGAIGVGSLLGASAASAATISVTTLPGNVKMMSTDTLTLNVANATVCPGTGWTLTAKIPGKQDAILLTGVQCSGTTLMGTVTDNPASAKKNAVVKMMATNAATSQTVEATMVVHLKDGKSGKKS